MQIFAFFFKILYFHNYNVLLYCNMKRLLNVASGLFFLSIFPILSWILLGITLNDTNISNVFSLTYPMQFVWGIIITFFGTAVNIKKYKENKNNDVVFSGIIWGSIFGLIIFGIVAIFVDKYITFMNMDPQIYHNFCLYSLGNLFFQLVFSLIMEKLYFENKEKLANLHSFCYNFLSFAVLIITSLITKNTIIIISVTLSSVFIYNIILSIWQFNKFKFILNFLSCFKYESAGLSTNLFMLIIYLFGFKNSFTFGNEYIIAINFVAMITDVLWDSFGAIKKCSKVDISQNNFKFKESLKNGLLLISLGTTLSIVSFFSLFNTFKVTLTIGLIVLAFQIFDFYLTSIINTLYPFLQLQFSATKTTIIEIFAQTVRVILSVFLPTAYCTEIGQCVASIILFSLYLFIIIKYYKLENDSLIFKEKINTTSQND